MPKNPSSLFSSEVNHAVEVLICEEITQRNKIQMWLYPLLRGFYAVSIPRFLLEIIKAKVSYPCFTMHYTQPLGSTYAMLLRNWTQQKPQSPFHPVGVGLYLLQKLHLSVEVFASIFFCQCCRLYQLDSTLIEPFLNFLLCIKDLSTLYCTAVGMQFSGAAPCL